MSIYHIIHFIFNLLLWTYPFLFYNHPYWACGDDWPHVHPLLPYAIYGDSLDLPLSVIFHNLFISTGSYLFISLPPIFHLLSIWSGLYHTFIVMPHIGSMSFISALCLFFTLLYFILLYTVHHRSYIHTCNFSLVLKPTRANKELYLSSLVVFPSKECKQDRIDQSFKPHFLLSHMAWHSAWMAAPLYCCWVVTSVKIKEKKHTIR